MLLTAESSSGTLELSGPMALRSARHNTARKCLRSAPRYAQPSARPASRAWCRSSLADRALLQARLRLRSQLAEHEQRCPGPFRIGRGLAVLRLMPLCDSWLLIF